MVFFTKKFFGLFSFFFLKKISLCRKTSLLLTCERESIKNAKPVRLQMVLVNLTR